jgi:hypothetical protein
MRIRSGQLPPVGAFWSLTMYDAKTRFLVRNPLDRYLINSPMLPGLKVEANGDILLYLQKDSPGADLESNWPPTPNGPFAAVLRLHLPKPSALDGTWIAPEPACTDASAQQRSQPYRRRIGGPSHCATGQGPGTRARGCPSAPFALIFRRSVLH